MSADSAPPGPAAFASRLTALTDADKNRLICVLIHGKLENVNWQSACEAYGSSSVASMRTMYSSVLKKINGFREGNNQSNGNVTKPATASNKRKAPAKKVAKKAITNEENTNKDDADKDGEPETKRVKKEDSDTD